MRKAKGSLWHAKVRSSRRDCATIIMRMGVKRVTLRHLERENYVSQTKKRIKVNIHAALLSSKNGTPGRWHGTVGMPL